jgi:hypothetical protein
LSIFLLNLLVRLRLSGTTICRLIWLREDGTIGTKEALCGSLTSQMPDLTSWLQIRVSSTAGRPEQRQKFAVSAMELDSAFSHCSRITE